MHERPGKTMTTKPDHSLLQHWMYIIIIVSPALMIQIIYKCLNIDDTRSIHLKPHCTRFKKHRGHIPHLAPQVAILFSGERSNRLKLILLQTSDSCYHQTVLHFRL